MFTGIIEAVGEVVETEERDQTRRLRIEVGPAFLEGVAPGASIAIDGACLTPVHIERGAFVVEAVGTTLSRTVAGTYGAGSRVNLERALAMGGRLDGHLVQGHVDGIGYLESILEAGEYRLLQARIPDEVHGATIPHGSIALNGVSLTVNRLDADGRIEVAIIPHTWSETNFQYLSIGDPLNVEGDLIGKYVGRLLGRSRAPTPPDSDPAQGEPSREEED